MKPACVNVAAAMLAAGDDAAVAVFFANETWSYRRLRAEVAIIVRALEDAGCRPGQRVGLLAENSPFFVAAYLAVMHAGMCVVPLQLGAGPATLTSLIAAMEMPAVIASERFAAVVRGLELDAPPRVLLPSTHATEPAATLPLPAAVDAPCDLAAIYLTSGSTGEPKGVMISHRNIECNTRDILCYTGIAAADRAMLVLPLYYCFGLSVLHTHLWAGGSVVLNNRFMFPEKVLDDLAERACTGMAGVPSTFQILLRKTRFAQRPFPALRWLQQAGGRLANAFLRELRAAHPAVRLFVMYGQTEATARLSYLPPEQLDEKLGSIGRGLPNTRLEVLRADGTPVAPGSDELGEIVASGDNISSGYWNDPDETALYFRAGRLWTGDLARVDGEGFIYVVERARDFIKSMGNRVSPKEIEDVLCEWPGVVEAAVVGVPDEIWGEAIQAFIVTARDDSADAEAIRAHCLAKLPNFKVPQRFEFRRELPRTASGKVAKDRLRREQPRAD